jgi:type III pantothenate kinase
MRNLIIDIGNSCVKYGVFDDNQLIFNGKNEGHSFCNIAEVAAKYDTQHGIICTTINLYDKQREELLGLNPGMVFMDYKTAIPIKNLYKSPHTLGMDRLAAAIGAYNETKNDTLIIDLGTAITYDFVTKAGEFVGGNISLGMEMRFKALKDYTSQLPLVSPEGPHPSLGEDTDTAIRCGVLDGMTYEIEGYIRQFTIKHPNLCIFFTGGDELYFEDEIKKRIFADKFIVMKGLNEVLMYNESLKRSHKTK